MPPLVLPVSPVELQRLQPHVAAVADACKAKDEDPWRFAGLGFRESGWGYGWGYTPAGSPMGYGDGGNAFGYFQLDKRFNRDLVASIQAAAARGAPTEEIVRLQIDSAIDYLVEARDLFVSNSLAPLSGDLLERAVYAAYNSDLRLVYHMAKAVLKDPAVGVDHVDMVTTDHDYSGWIFAKALGLRQAAPTLFP